METWKPVKDYEGCYEVSDLGRVFSVRRQAFMTLVPKKPYGHLVVTLKKDGKQKTFMVHFLVLQAFVGERPEGLICLHGRGGVADNSVGNLRYGTHVDNALDMIKDGNSGRRLTNEEVAEAIQMVREGCSIRVVAKRFHVSHPTIIRLATGKSYWWLNKDDKHERPDPLPLEASKDAGEQDPGTSTDGSVGASPNWLDAG